MIYELFLPIIILFGIITSYEDYQEGKIRNRYVILFLLASVILHAFLLYNGKINTQYLKYFAIFIPISVLIGFLLYFIDFWTAGDGKLYITYSILVPLTVYQNNLPNILNPLIILINTFIPYFVLSAAYIILTSTRYKKIQNIKHSIPSAVLSIVYVFSVTWVIELLLKLIKIPVNSFTIIIFSAVIIFMLEKLKTKRLSFLKGMEEYIIMIIISIIRVIFDYKSILTYEFLTHFIIYYFIIILVRTYIRESTSSFFIKESHLLHLRRGMIINDKIVKKGKMYVKLDKIFAPFVESEFPEVLDDDDIRKIAKLYKQNKFDFKKVTVQNTMPFAPIIFIGVLITIFTKGALILLF